MSEHTSFQDFMSAVRINADAAEALYGQMVAADSDEDRQEAKHAMNHAVQEIALAVASGSAQGNRDAVALSKASRHDFDPLQAEVDVDLMAAIAADVDAGLSDMGSDPVADADRDAHCLRDVAAAEGDLLASPPFDVEVPGSIWSETSALEGPHHSDPDQYPFPLPIDPDEEKPW